MGLYEFLFSFLIALFFTLFFSFGFKNEGPWGNIWLYFIVLFLGIWASSFYLVPVGPLFYGVNWVPLFFIGLFFALLLASSISYKDHKRYEKRKEKELGGPPSIIHLGGFFWVIIILLILIIAFGFN